MIDLDKALAELREKHGRIVEFDEEDDTFYEAAEGERRQVRIETPVEEADGKDSMQRLLGYFKSNATYEARLTPTDRDLRRIIVDQVDDAVCQQLAEEGHMELRDGEYHSLHIGVCHMVWGRMKQILKDKYNIDWASPKDENPMTFYD